MKSVNGENIVRRHLVLNKDTISGVAKALKLISLNAIKLLYLFTDSSHNWEGCASQHFQITIAEKDAEN